MTITNPVVVTNCQTGLGCLETITCTIATNTLHAIDTNSNELDDPSKTAEQKFRRRERIIERCEYENSRERKRKSLAIENVTGQID